MLRHINVSSLWVQERQDRKDTEYRKAFGTDHLADMMIDDLLREASDKWVGHLKQWRMSGRAQSGLDVQGRGDIDGTQEDFRKYAELSSHRNRCLRIGRARVVICS